MERLAITRFLFFILVVFTVGLFTAPVSSRTRSCDRHMKAVEMIAQFNLFESIVRFSQSYKNELSKIFIFCRLKGDSSWMS